MENILFSFNIVVPIFLLVVLGFLLKRWRFADASFFSVCDKMGFQICLPCLLFMDIAEASFSDIEPKLIWFCGGFVIFSILTFSLLVPLFIKDSASRGAFIQGACRSNSAILGVTIAGNMLGKPGSTAIAAVLPVIVLLFNVCCVIILSIHMPEDSRLSRKEVLARIFKNIVTNPLIIAVLLALLWNLTTLPVPLSMSRTLNYLSDLTVPLALLSLGSNFSWEELKHSAGAAVLCACCRTIFVPIVAVGAAALLGISGTGLGIVFILFGSPAAISSYTMAKQMKSNHILAGEIVLISTLMSSVTIFLGILFLRTMGLV